MALPVLTDRDYGDERDHDTMSESELVAALEEFGLIPPSPPQMIEGENG